MSFTKNIINHNLLKELFTTLLIIGSWVSSFSMIFSTVITKNKADIIAVDQNTKLQNPDPDKARQNIPPIVDNT